jgi:hypothetical protein
VECDSCLPLDQRRLGQDISEIHDDLHVVASLMDADQGALSCDLFPPRGL